MPGPFLNMRFRVEIEGLRETGVVEVAFPHARIERARQRVRASYGNLILRRGLGDLQDWHAWWDEARRTPRAPARTITVTLLNESGENARRWTFDRATPMAYSVSSLNALGNEVVIETLELTVEGFAASSGPAPSKRRRSRTS